MIKRSLILFFAAFSLTCLSSCAVVGGLLRSVLQLPGSVIGSVTEAEAGPEAPTEGVNEQPLRASNQADVSIVVTPVK